MSNIDIARAWKDEEYRNSLSEEERAQLPENPAGATEKRDEEMDNVVGGGLLDVFKGSEGYVCTFTGECGC